MNDSSKFPPVTETQLASVEETLDTIPAATGVPLLSDAQRIELERRIAEDDSQPLDVIPWEEVRVSTLSRFL